jgi:hypothetical protein
VNRNAFVIATLHEKAGEPALVLPSGAPASGARTAGIRSRSSQSPIKSYHPNGTCQDEIYFAWGCSSKMREGGAFFRRPIPSCRSEPARYFFSPAIT